MKNKAVIKLVLSTFCGAALLLGQSASANVINVLGAGDFAADQISTVTGQTGLGDENVLKWLQLIVADAQLPAPTTAQSNYLKDGGPILAGDYLVLHYGVGTDGSKGTGGGLVALYFDADQASYDVPALGSGPNGTGGISFARLYDHTTRVPDGGATLIMLSMGLLGLGCAGRIKRKA